MLRKIRIAVAGIFFVCITLLFLDFTGTLHAWLGWMAKIQFLPAVLAANTLVVAALLLITILFGRVYCSVICPLGIMQDIISWFNGRLKKKNRFRFRYTDERKWIRYGFLAIFIAVMALGIHSIAAILAPYSAYGRIASNLLAPLYKLCNNFFAWIAERADSYAFYSTEVWIKSIPTFIVAAATFILLFIFAWKGGRTYCNNICPVGTILGIFSRKSLFAPVIDTEKCRNCGLCGKQCKSSCIDMKNHKIDYSRCVVCMDCLDACKEGAIHYSYRKSPSKSGMAERQTETRDVHHSQSDPSSSNQGRRAFITSAALVTTATVAEAAKDRYIPMPEKGKAERNVKVVPAGSISLKNFEDHCTACQLCVSACPNHVLQPSSSLLTLMQPQMQFDKGHCRPECTLCSEVCPSGAIRPVSIEEKSSIQTGHAVVSLDLCIANTDDVKCGNCARHCPAGAIRLVKKNPEDENSLRIPAVNEDRCIGCGACEHLCPTRPVPAIHIEGNLVHRTI